MVSWPNFVAHVFLLIQFCFLLQIGPKLLLLTMVSLGGEHSISVSTSNKSLMKDRSSGIFLNFVLEDSSGRQGERKELRTKYSSLCWGMPSSACLSDIKFAPRHPFFETSLPWWIICYEGHFLWYLSRKYYVLQESCDLVTAEFFVLVISLWQRWHDVFTK